MSSSRGLSPSPHTHSVRMAFICSTGPFNSQLISLMASPMPKPKFFSNLYGRVKATSFTIYICVQTLENRQFNGKLCARQWLHNMHGCGHALEICWMHVSQINSRETDNKGVPEHLFRLNIRRWWCAIIYSDGLWFTCIGSSQANTLAFIGECNFHMQCFPNISQRFFSMWLLFVSQSPVLQSNSTNK